MKTLNIEVPNGYEIDKEKSTFEKIVFKKILNEYPKSIHEVNNRSYAESRFQDVAIHQCRTNAYLSSESRAKAFVALMKLVELRDAWNEIDGDKEFEYGCRNYTIGFSKNNKLSCYINANVFRVLHFRKEESRDLFLETFKDLIEEAKELI